MAPGPTGRTGNEGYQGYGRPQDADRPRPAAPGTRPQWPEQAADPRTGREVPRPRPAQDRRAVPNGYREDYATPPRPVRPQPRTDPRDPREGRDTRDPYGYAANSAPRAPQDTREGRGSRRRPAADPRDTRDTRDPRALHDAQQDYADYVPRDPRDPRATRTSRENPSIRDARFEHDEIGPRSPRGPGRRQARSGGSISTADRPFADHDGDPDFERGIEHGFEHGFEHSAGHDGDLDADDELANGRRREAGHGRRGRRRADKLTPQQRRRRKIIRRTVLGVFLLFFLAVGWSITDALTKPGNETVQARLAEWGRSHYLGWAVTWLENEQYNANPPKTGGQLSQSDLQQLQQPTATPSLAQGEKVLPPIQPFLSNPVPGEGTWSPAVVVNGVPLVQVAKLRSDPEHTSYLSAVAYIDQKHSKFVLHSGSQEPGNAAAFGSTDHITPAEMPGLIATWNGAFRLTNGDAKGGFFLNGKTYGTLVPGQASEVFMKDGSINIGQWGRDFSMGPDVVGVRQNLGLLVDNGQVNPNVDSSDKNLWGVTVNNKYFVWRSGVGITADGNIVYAMGPTLSVRTLAELLQRAGAVRAMELDINMEWVSFMTYDGSKDPKNPVPTKLLPDFKRTGTRYFSTDERDFVAVYAR